MPSAAESITSFSRELHGGGRQIPSTPAFLGMEKMTCEFPPASCSGFNPRQLSMAAGQERLRRLILWLTVSVPARHTRAAARHLLRRNTAPSALRSLPDLRAWRD